MPFDLDLLLNMSDEDLLAYAAQIGIDTSPFTLGAFPSATPTEFAGQIPDPGAIFRGGPQTGLPQFAAQREIPDIRTNISLPGLSMRPDLDIGIPEVIISPEARRAVGDIYNVQRQRGTEELMRMAREAAGSRGLNLTDTPIFDPLLRGKTRLESELGAAESGALLNLSENLRNFLQQQSLERERATQQRFGLGLQAATSQEQLIGDRLRLLEAAQQARDRGDEGRAQILEQAAQYRMGLSQRAGEFGANMGLNQAQFLEEARQRRFGLGEQQRQFEQNFYEMMRQFQTEQERLREQSRRSFLQNIYGIQENLAQQAFANRLQLAQQSGQFASNLSGQRLGLPTGSRTVNPPNIGQAMQAIGTGFQGFFGSPTQGFIFNPNFKPGPNDMFIPAPTSRGLFG